MNKRDIVLNLISNQSVPDYIPAAFFMHFGSAFHQGQAAINKHLDFFHYTDMDFIKIQYEQTIPTAPMNLKPQDWAQIPRCTDEFFKESFDLVEGLVKAAHHEALIIMTIYSPFMWAANWAGDMGIGDHLKEYPESVLKGLEIMTENVLTLVRGCKRAGVDGFYVSSQGGEDFRFRGTDIFQQYIRPTDLVVWDEIKSCSFNVLHICDYMGGYDDFKPFLMYPGHIVNSSLKLGDSLISAAEVSRMFGRPFMGGLDRKGVLSTGKDAELRQVVADALSQVPDRFILAADCTVPSNTPWDNLKLAIEMAHHYHQE